MDTNKTGLVQKACSVGDVDSNHSCRAQEMMLTNPSVLHVYSTILEAIHIFHKERVDTILVIQESEQVGGVELTGRIFLKDVLRLLFPCLLKKDLAAVNQIVYSSIKPILIPLRRTVGSNSDIRHVLSIMQHDPTNVVAVVQNNKLLGQICHRNLLRLFSRLAEESDFSHPLLSRVCYASAMVSDVIAEHILCLGPRDDIAKAICVFLSTPARNIPILTREAKLESILSQYDIMDYVMEMLDPLRASIFKEKGLVLDKTIGALIHKNVLFIAWNTGLAEATSKLVLHEYLGLAVTDIQQKFSGILSSEDILKWFCNHLTD